MLQRSRFMNFGTFKIEDIQIYCKKCGWWKKDNVDHEFILYKSTNLDDFIKEK
jgi:hypothetical protein